MAAWGSTGPTCIFGEAFLHDAGDESSPKSGSVDGLQSIRLGCDQKQIDVDAYVSILVIDARIDYAGRTRAAARRQSLDPRGGGSPRNGDAARITSVGSSKTV